MNAKKYIGILIALTVFFVQFFLVRGVGMSWDEPASFFIGRMNLQFWTTGDWTNVIDYTNTRRFPGPMYYVMGEEFYPPFPFTVAAAASRIFSDRLHLVSMIDGFHIGEIILGAVGVAAFYGLALEMGLTSAVSAGMTIVYALYPTIWGQMRSDAKDIPLVSMLTLSVYVFFRWIRAWEKSQTSKAWGWGFLWAITLGLAEGSKPSAAIIVPILALWFIVSLLISADFRRRMKHLPFFVFSTVVFGLLAVCIFYLSWPWLWNNPVGKLSVVLSFFRTVGQGMPVLYSGIQYRAGMNLPWHYPFAILLYQTPVEITVLAIAGVIAGTWMALKKRNIFSLFVLLWFWVGIGRFMLPGFLIYAKVRHFIDVMPAFFLLAGIGAEWVSRALPQFAGKVRILSVPIRQHGFLTSSYAAIVILAVIIIHETAISVRFYPYEPSYFNFLTGGSKTVADKHLFDIEYWGTGVREAMEYIARTDTKPTTVYSCLMRHLAMYYETPMVTTVPDHPENAGYLLVPNSMSWYTNPYEFAKAMDRRVYTVVRDGAELFYVYKNIRGFGYRCGYETITSYGIKE